MTPPVHCWHKKCPRCGKCRVAWCPKFGCSCRASRRERHYLGFAYRIYFLVVLLCALICWVLTRH